MSISHIRIKIKDSARLLLGLIDRRDVFALCSIFLAGVGGYLFGRLDPLNPAPKAVEIRVGERVSATTTLPIAVPTTEAKSVGKYVASNKGKKYYLPTCSGGKSISEANKIWFSSKEEAEKAGYTPATTCKGI